MQNMSNRHGSCQIEKKLYEVIFVPATRELQTVRKPPETLQKLVHDVGFPRYYTLWPDNVLQWNKSLLGAVFPSESLEPLYRSVVVDYHVG